MDRNAPIQDVRCATTSHSVSRFGHGVCNAYRTVFFPPFFLSSLPSSVANQVECNDKPRDTQYDSWWYVYPETAVNMIV